jgi:methionyl-tRNA formyltransferase
MKDEALTQKSNAIMVVFRMLPKVVLDMPALGTFKPRPASGIEVRLPKLQLSMAKTGVTTFFIDDKIDTEGKQLS